MLSKRDLQLIEAIVDDRLDVKLEQKLEEKFEEKLAPLRSDWLQFKDDILTEIVAMRQQLEIATGYRQYIENHEDRISRLEVHTGLTQSS